MPVIRRIKGEFLPQAKNVGDLLGMRFIALLNRVIGEVFLGARLFRTFRVEGASMRPFLQHGHRVLVRSINHQCCSPARCDAVIVQDLTSPSVYYIKRVIGLPGEHIFISKGYVYVNDIPLVEPYVMDDGKNTESLITRWILDSDEYFVLGDNRSDSRDSRRFGPVSSAQIVGKVMIRYWPLRMLG
ncbi:MAG: signal peptidase I [SAR202 cluster bacterium Io17-Chloro-G3]|nr:MAG: signal peptidase I [SAR202 cluster bacterium Io17-Chloro-G3]